jgi:hypothetical protein
MRVANSQEGDCQEKGREVRGEAIDDGAGQAVHHYEGQHAAPGAGEPQCEMHPCGVVRHPGDELAGVAERTGHVPGQVGESQHRVQGVERQRRPFEEVRIEIPRKEPQRHGHEDLFIRASRGVGQAEANPPQAERGANGENADQRRVSPDESLERPHNRAIIPHRSQVGNTGTSAPPHRARCSDVTKAGIVGRVWNRARSVHYNSTVNGAVRCVDACAGTHS